MSEQALELDMDGRYAVASMPGIAFYLRGYAEEWTEESWLFVGEKDDDVEDETLWLYVEPEKVENRQMVQAVMVGDDYVHTIDVEELSPISEEDYCCGCGQIGCPWG